MFALKVRHTLERSPIMTIALIISICLSIVLGITTMISQKNLKSEKAEKATMAEAVEEAKSKLEDTKAIGDKLNKELEKAHKDCAELRKAAEDAEFRYQKATAEIRDIKTAGRTAEKMAEKAAKAEEEAAVAEQKAEAAAKEFAEATARIDSAKNELEDKRAEIKELEEKLRSLSKLYRAVADGDEDIEALEEKSAAIAAQIQDASNTITRAKWCDERLMSYIDESTDALLLAYDQNGNLLTSVAVTLKTSANYSVTGFYRLWCDVENAAKQDARELQNKLAGAAKIICFAAESFDITVGDEEIIFHHFKGDISIGVGKARVTLMNIDDKKIVNLVGCEERKHQEKIVEALQEEQKRIQEQIFAITQSELVNPAADYLTHK